MRAIQLKVSVGMMLEAGDRFRLITASPIRDTVEVEAFFF